jgi:hypothetical protein
MGAGTNQKGLSAKNGRELSLFRRNVTEVCNLSIEWIDMKCPVPSTLLRQ